MNKEEAIQKRKELYKKVSCGNEYVRGEYLYVCGEDGHCNACKRIDEEIKELDKIVNIGENKK